MGANTSFAHGELRAIVDRLERLDEEMAKIASDTKEVYAEARDKGFDTKIIRKVMGLRRKDAAKREEETAMLDVYLGALGMLAETPLGAWAVDNAKGGDNVEAARRAGFDRGKAGLPPYEAFTQKSKAVSDAHMDSWHAGNETRLKQVVATPGPAATDLADIPAFLDRRKRQGAPS